MSHEKAIWKGSHNPVRGLTITMAINHLSKSWDDPPSELRFPTDFFGLSKAVFLYLSLIQDTHSTCSWTFIAAAGVHHVAQLRCPVLHQTHLTKATLHGVVSNIMLMLQKIWQTKNGMLTNPCENISEQLGVGC